MAREKEKAAGMKILSLSPDYHTERHQRCLPFQYGRAFDQIAQPSPFLGGGSRSHNEGEEKRCNCSRNRITRSTHRRPWYINSAQAAQVPGAKRGTRHTKQSGGWACSAGERETEESTDFALTSDSTASYSRTLVQVRVLTHNVKQGSDLTGADRLAHTCDTFCVQVFCHVQRQDGQTGVLVTWGRVFHQKLALVRNVVIVDVPVDHSNGGR